VEFLVAMAVTLLVTATALSTFSDALRTNESVTLMADMTDNLRTGMNLMVQDLIQAGTGIPTGGIPIPSGGSPSAPINRPGPPGTTYTFPIGSTVLPAVAPGASLGPQITSPDAAPGANTDIITILYADNSLALDTDPINRPAAPGITACNGTIAADGSTVTFDSACVDLTAGNIKINPGDLIMFSNAQGNVIQTVTDVAGQKLTFGTNDAFKLNLRTDPSGTIQQLQSPAGSGTYPPTTATRIWMITYYLDNVTDLQHVRLIRQVNLNPPQPVGEVIENLRVTYNFVDGVTNPSNQSTVPAGLSENQIRAVNLLLAARSTATSMKTRKYLRTNLGMQVSLRSMAYVSRYN
jgi:hypothetical protein